MYIVPYKLRLVEIMKANARTQPTNRPFAPSPMCASDAYSITAKLSQTSEKRQLNNETNVLNALSQRHNQLTSNYAQKRSNNIRNGRTNEATC